MFGKIEAQLAGISLDSDPAPASARFSGTTLAGLVVPPKPAVTRCFCQDNGRRSSGCQRVLANVRRRGSCAGPRLDDPNSLRNACSGLLAVIPFRRSHLMRPFENGIATVMLPVCTRAGRHGRLNHERPLVPRAVIPKDLQHIGSTSTSPMLSSLLGWK
jgi:hypothetical protein